MTPPKSQSQPGTDKPFGMQSGATVPFDSIQDSGAYICNWSGHLLRVPDDGVSPGRSPLLDLLGTEPLLVTKISTNPFLAVTKARILASNYDLPVSF